MSDNLLAYNRVKQNIMAKFNNHNCKDTILENVKNRFKHQIKSPRLFERIHCFQDLLDILERRKELSEKDTKPLIEINRELNNPIYASEHDQVAPKFDLYNVLAQELGKDYQSFARYLNIHNSQIEMITASYPIDVTARIWKILQCGEEIYSSFEDYYRKIHEALVKSRRKDLSNKLKSMWKMSV